VLDDPEAFQYWLRLYSNYKRGILPEPGSLMEQSAYVMQMFGILDTVVAQIQKHHEDEAAKNAKKGQGSG
jgi:hypothetical protein